MSRAERIALWSIVGVLALGLIVLTVVVSGELAELWRIVGQMASAPPPFQTPRAESESHPTPGWGGETVERGTGRVQVGIAGVRALSDTLTLTVTVRFGGAGDLLYEPPVVIDEAGQTYPVTPDSLEAARFAFLDLVTQGQARAELAFAGVPPEGARLTLVFNPGQLPGDPLTPRVEVPVPLPAQEKK